MRIWNGIVVVAQLVGLGLAGYCFHQAWRAWRAGRERQAELARAAAQVALEREVERQVRGLEERVYERLVGRLQTDLKLPLQVTVRPWGLDARRRMN